ncbi:hypothetical protein GWK47_032385 [Chionoecetes opilio]|uniref:Uncharacterized protein n=1 Tax=Chionoecetes opilio TaxID=41210 RepID=A0A8J4YKE0_CHIOP|nr:hypothetical protein GWK47_032385 [Chionoecetes opilio]
MLAAYVDLKKAFDSVHLIFAELLEVLMTALKALHEEAKPLGLEVSWFKTKVQVMTTRKQTEVWLLGHSVPTITGAKLPSRGDVLRQFFYAHKEEKKTVQQSAAEAAKDVLDFWTRARIPTIAETSVRRKITGLFRRVEDPEQKQE